LTRSLSLRVLAMVAMAAIAVPACTRSSGSSNAKPSDFYAAAPKLEDVRMLMGDDNWWPAPPSFGVRPLNADSTPPDERFSFTLRYLHIGTVETVIVDYIMWNTSSAATTRMNNIQSALGTSATGPKVGDQVLYYGSQISGAAPYETTSYVRVGQAMAVVLWARKDGYPTVNQLGKLAAKFTSRLKDLLAGKIRSTPAPTSDVALLPPAGMDITLLGTARIPIEAAVLMLGFASPEAVAKIFHDSGVDDFVYGDYALDTDTHMEVRALLFEFSSQAAATSWIDAIRGSSQLDAEGIFSTYYDVSGQYYFAFSSGTKAALLNCLSTSPSEAASRACEAPLARQAVTWKLSLES